LWSPICSVKSSGLDALTLRIFGSAHQISTPRRDIISAVAGRIIKKKKEISSNYSCKFAWSLNNNLNYKIVYLTPFLKTKRLYTFAPKQKWFYIYESVV
jgi:hypothetical protein